MFPDGLAKFGWLNASVAKARNRIVTRSLITNVFAAAMSQLMMVGPIKVLTPALPYIPTSAGFVHTGFETGHPGTAKAAGLNILPAGTLAYGLPITFGRPPILLVFAE